MSKFRHITTVLLGCTVLSCATTDEPARPSAEEDLAAIAEARGRLESALAADDVPGIMADLAADHLTMPPDGPTPADSETLTAFHQARVEQFSFESSFTTDDIQLFGDLAIERWSGETRLVPREGGDAVEDSTKGIWVWERQEDGSWKLLWSIWNSNLLAEDN